MAYSKRKLYLLMDGLGYEEKNKGTADIRAAVEIVSDDPGAMFSKEVYPAIAQARGTNPAAIERSIRHATAVAMQNPNWGTVWRGIGGWGAPTNVEVVRRLARECGLED